MNIYIVQHTYLYYIVGIKKVFGILEYFVAFVLLISRLVNWFLD